MDVGQAKSVDITGDLNCNHVINAVGPDGNDTAQFNQREELLRATYRAIIAEAEDKGYTSIAIPPISVGIFGGPGDRDAWIKQASGIAVEEVDNALKSCEHLQEVIFACRDDSRATTSPVYQQLIDQRKACISSAITPPTSAATVDTSSSMPSGRSSIFGRRKKKPTSAGDASLGKAVLPQRKPALTAGVSAPQARGPMRTVLASSFTLNKTDEDGDCFHRSLSLAAGGRGNNKAIRQARKDLLQFLNNNHEAFAAYHESFRPVERRIGKKLVTDNTIEKLRETLTNRGYWAGNEGDLVAILAAQNLGRELCILERIPGDDEHYQVKPGFASYNPELPGVPPEEGLPPIYLLHSRNSEGKEHYDWLTLNDADSALDIISHHGAPSADVLGAGDDANAGKAGPQNLKPAPPSPPPPSTPPPMPDITPPGSPTVSTPDFTLRPTKYQSLSTERAFVMELEGLREGDIAEAAQTLEIFS